MHKFMHAAIQPSSIISSAFQVPPRCFLGRHLEGTWKAPGIQVPSKCPPGAFLESTWKALGRHLEGTWKAPGRHLEGTWKRLGAWKASGKEEAPGRHLEGTWKAPGRHPKQPSTPSNQAPQATKHPKQQGTTLPSLMPSHNTEGLMKHIANRNSVSWRRRISNKKHYKISILKW